MPLIKESLEAQIVNMLTQMSTKTENQPKAIQDFAKELATIIDAYVRSATVNVSVMVATTGTATAQTGAGSGTGTLS